MPDASAAGTAVSAGDPVARLVTAEPRMDSGGEEGAGVPARPSNGAAEGWRYGHAQEEVSLPVTPVHVAAGQVHSAVPRSP